MLKQRGSYNKQKLRITPAAPSALQSNPNLMNKIEASIPLILV